MEQDKKKKVDKGVAQNKTGKTATGKPKNPIELDPQLKYDDTGGLRQEAIVLAASDLDEGKALTIAQRQKRARIFKRNLPKIERAREMAKRKQASQAKIQKRAEVAAREILKKRFAGRKGTPYAELSVSEKIQVDKKLEGKAKLIKKIAMRLLPKIRRAEYERLKSYYKGEPMKSLHQEPSKVNEAFETMLGVFSTEDKSTIKKMVEQSQPEDLVDIIENMIDDLAKEGNPLVETLRGMLDQVAPKNPIYEAIKRKADANELPFEILEEVFNRGLDAWDGKRGTQEQYAFDRVNSYISHGMAYDLDADLREARADVKRTKVKLPDGRVVWRSYRKSTEVEKKNERDAEETNESKNTPYVKPHDGDRAWKASNKHGKVKYFGKDFKAAAEKHAGITTEGAGCEGTPALTKKYKKQTPGQKTNEAFDSFFEAKHTENPSDERKEIELTRRGKEKPDEKQEIETIRRAHIQVKKKVIDEGEGWNSYRKAGKDPAAARKQYLAYDRAERKGVMPGSATSTADAVAAFKAKGGKVKKFDTYGNVKEAEVWDKPNPKKESKPLTPAQKAKAKARAKAAGRPYPNMVDNIWAANEEFELHAEIPEGSRKKLGDFMTKAKAAAHVEKLEDSGKFPEGHDAILTHKKTGEKHVYTDGWEKTNEEAEVSTSLNEAFIMDRVAGIGATITAEQAGISITPQFQHYPGVEELNQLLAVESLIKESFGKMLEEVDEEGKMARGQLSSLIKNAQSLVAKMKDDKQLDAWIQSKITKAADYINAVAEYLDNNKQDVDE